jgi:hypothetical protein
MSEDRNRPATLADLEKLQESLEKRIEKTDTKLLNAFHGWARSMEICVRHSNQNVFGMNERLALAEERISELERNKSIMKLSSYRPGLISTIST